MNPLILSFHTHPAYVPNQENTVVGSPFSATFLPSSRRLLSTPCIPPTPFTPSPAFERLAAQPGIRNRSLLSVSSHICDAHGVFVIELVGWWVGLIVHVACVTELHEHRLSSFSIYRPAGVLVPYN